MNATLDLFAGGSQPVRPGCDLMINAPDVVTKNLAFNTVAGKRRVRLSTNFLSVMGFQPGERLAVSMNSQAMTGFSVSPDPAGQHLIHQRSYKRGRSNNPFEAVIEFAGQSMLDQAFPSYTERFHVEMRNGRVVFSPLANRVHAIHNKLRRSSPWSAFVGLTGGVDIHCMESLGWHADVVLEHRPVEARDRAAGRNLTEVHALNTLVNSAPRILLNEDIYHLEIDRLERIMSDAPPVTLCHYSLGCDDHSNAKSKGDKQRALDDLSTMYDMVYPVLKQIEVIGPALYYRDSSQSRRLSGTSPKSTMVP